MSNIRLTVIVRKDLQLSPGLLAAQVSHMGDAFIRHRIVNRNMYGGDDKLTCSDLFTEYQLEWMKEPYLSVLAVNCYEDLIEIENHVKREDLPHHVWFDVVPSPTISDKVIRGMIGIAIGPADFDKIKIVTGSLDLY